MLDSRNLRHGSNVKRLIGALRSGHSAAYMGMLTKGLGHMTRFVDRLVSKPPPEPASFKCLYLVSLPRSGGTIVYQCAARCLDSVYISNLHLLFPTTATPYLRRSRSVLRDQSAGPNYYGYTSHWADVHEGYGMLDFLWQKYNDVPFPGWREQLRTHMLQIIRQLAPQPEEVIIFKFMRGYSVINLLHEALPEIVFVRVRREPREIIQSVLRAYHDLGTFHPVSAAMRGVNFRSDPIRFATDNILAIEDEMENQFSRLPEKNRLEIAYEDFCKSPFDTCRLMANALDLAASSLHDCTYAKSIKISKRKKVTDSEVTAIDEYLKTIKVQHQKAADGQRGK